MRPILIAAVLALAACSKNDQATNMQDVDESLTAENIVSNDITAIDAVTGDAANMAADVDLNFGNLDNGTALSNEAAPKAKKPARKPATPPPASAGDATSNAE
jgi:hypothetical protein